MSTSTRFARTGAFETAYVQKGAGGVPILLLHGGTGEADHHFFDLFLPHLGAGITAIAYDQRDCGASKVADDEPYEIADLADDAVKLIDALGYDKVHVLGNSMGGVVAQLMALKYPERVDRLILSVTFPADQNLFALNPDGAAKRARLLQAGDYAGLAAFMSSQSYADSHPEFVDHLRALVSGPVEASRQRRMAAAAKPHGLVPSSIPHQTLVIAGEEDELAPPWISEQLAAMIPNATSAVLSRVGHTALMQSPAEAAALVERFIVDGVLTSPS